MSNIPWQIMPDLAAIRQGEIRAEASAWRTWRELRRARRAERDAKQVRRPGRFDAQRPTDVTGSGPRPVPEVSVATAEPRRSFGSQRKELAGLWRANAEPATRRDVLKPSSAVRVEETP